MRGAHPHSGGLCMTRTAGSWARLDDSHWIIPLSHSALSIELSRYPIVLYHWVIPLSHSTLSIELSRYPIVLYHWVIPLSHSAPSIELSRCPIALHPLSYPAIHWAFPLPHCTLAIELSPYHIVPYSLSFLVMPKIDCNILSWSLTYDKRWLLASQLGVGVYLVQNHGLWLTVQFTRGHLGEDPGWNLG